MQTYRAIILMLRVGRSYCSEMEQILTPVRVFPLLLSYTCVRLIVQVLCGDRYFQMRCHILNLHNAFLIHMCGCVKS